MKGERAINAKSETPTHLPKRVRNLSLAQLSERCAEQTTLFFQQVEHDTRFCFELFRRALCEQDQAAWSLLVDQYRVLVRGWIRRHPSFPESGENDAFFLNRAFERLWSSIDEAKFKRFDDLRAVLRYLQMCINSVIIDHHRATRAVAMQTELSERDSALSNPSIELWALDRVERSRLWSYVQGTAKDRKELVCIHASFVLGLKPKQIMENFAEEFADVNEIYLVKQNVLARLRRDEQFAERFKPHD